MAGLSEVADLYAMEPEGSFLADVRPTRSAIGRGLPTYLGP